MTARDDISAMKAEYMGLYGLHLRGMLRWDEAKYRRMVMLENLLNVFGGHA